MSPEAQELVLRDVVMYLESLTVRLFGASMLDALIAARETGDEPGAGTTPASNRSAAEALAFFSALARVRDAAQTRPAPESGGRH